MIRVRLVDILYYHLFKSANLTGDWVDKVHFYCTLIFLRKKNVFPLTFSKKNALSGERAANYIEFFPKILSALFC